MSAHDLIMQIGRTARRRMRQIRERQELSRMGPRQFGDLALSRSDLMTIAGGAADARERLSKAADKLEVPVGRINQDRWHAVDMARACANCVERQRCKNWQSGNGNREDYRSFCPNAEAFAELAADPNPN